MKPWPHPSDRPLSPCSVAFYGLLAVLPWFVAAWWLLTAIAG